MKSSYTTPEITIVEIQHSGCLLIASQVNSVMTSDDVGITYSGGSSQTARTREYTSVWEQEW